MQEDEEVKRIEYLKLDATDVDKYVEFHYPVSVVHIKNMGPNTVYVRFDYPATTDYYPITSGEWTTISIKVKTVHAICEANETATLYILGFGKSEVGE